jgi:hypothetical protein
MSSMTQCNYCTLQEIKRRNPGKKIELVNDNGWQRVMIDGKDGGHSFMEVSDHCVC